MIFGNPGRFAIECKLDEDFDINETYSVAGEALIWIGGQQLGRYSQYNYFVRFVDMAECLNHVKFFLGSFWHDSFKNKSSEEIFELVYHHTYGDSSEDLTYEEVLMNSREYMRFIRTGNDLCPGLDGFAIVLINKTPETLCLLWQHKVRDKISAIQEFCIPIEEYFDVVEDFGRWIEEISKKKVKFLADFEWPE